MAGYAVLTSESTVQVLSPTFSNPVEYVTLQTTPSGVIASMPVQKDVFDAGGGGTDLGIFADAIEEIMALPHVVSAAGEQTLDDHGLLADNVAFTVEYTPPGTTNTSITTDVLIRAAELNFTDGQIGVTLRADVEAQLDKAYANLKAMAAG